MLPEKHKHGDNMVFDKEPVYRCREALSHRACPLRRSRASSPKGRAFPKRKTSSKNRRNTITEKEHTAREAELARREAALAAREAQLEQEQAKFEAARAEAPKGRKTLLNNNDPDFVNPKEKLYDKFPLTVHQMDIIIGVLFALIVLFLVLGFTHTSFFGLFGG